MTDEIQNDDSNPIFDAIASAEVIRDPLDGLVDRIVDDAGAAFKPEVLEALNALKAEDLAAFESLRAELKGSGCRVTALDVAMAGEAGPSERHPSQADALTELAGEAEPFHAPDETAYADIEIDGHRETWPIRSKGFRRWLTRRYFEETGGAPSADALQSALNVVEARAYFDGPERQVFNRVGSLDGRLYLNLGDPTWRAVEIDAEGWRVIDKPPVRFRRSAGMQPLPVPERGGSIDALRAFLNVKSDEDFVLVVAWMLAVLRDCGPYPLLVLSGEEGSAKSTFSAILRALLDPNKAPLRALPRDERDLFIAATNGHVLAFDNISKLPDWTSDTFCRLATGGGFAVRQLFTDNDEVLFEAARPILLNGIEDMVSRPDLADRAVFLTLEPIPEDRRRTKAEIWAAFEAERPRLLGVLLDGLVEGLKRLPETHLPAPPRMADFALWATACETAYWPSGTFLPAYAANRDAAVEDVIEADPVAAAMRDLMKGQTAWSGTATDLLLVLTEAVGERIAKSSAWPANARALSSRLRRAATVLRKVGIKIDHKREGRARNRIIHITTQPTPVDPDPGAAQPCAPTSTAPDTGHGAEDGPPGTRTVDDVADGTPDARNDEDPPTVRAEVAENGRRDGADAKDANGGQSTEDRKEVVEGRL